MNADLATVSHAAAGVMAGHLWRAVWQGGGAILLVWAVGRLGSRWSPGLRCWLWRLAYLKLMTALLWITPVDLPLLPPSSHAPGSSTAAERLPRPIRLMSEVGLLDRSAGLERADRSMSAASGPAMGAGRNDRKGPVQPRTPARRWGMSVSLASLQGALAAAVWLVSLWLLGTAWTGTGVLRGWRSAARLRERCEPVRDEALVDCCRRLAARLHLGRPPELLRSEEVGSPVLVGGRRPAILLPTSLLSLCQRSELELVIAHELAHVRRHDLRWAWLPTVAGTLFWFHPLVRLAQREWRLAQEMASDELAVLLTGAPPLTYGHVVLKVAAHRQGPRFTEPAAVGAVGSYHALRQRLAALPRVRPLSPWRWRLIGALLAVTGAAAIVPWRVTAQEARQAADRSAWLRQRGRFEQRFGAADRSAERIQVRERGAARVVPGGAPGSARSVTKEKSLRRLERWRHQQRLAELEHQRRLEQEAHQRRLAEREHLQRLERKAHERRLAQQEHARRLQQREQQHTHLQRLSEQEHTRRLAAQLHQQRLAERERLQRLETQVHQLRLQTRLPRVPRTPEQERLNQLQAEMMDQLRAQQKRLVNVERREAQLREAEQRLAGQRRQGSTAQLQASLRSLQLRRQQQERQLQQLLAQKRQLMAAERELRALSRHLARLQAQQQALALQRQRIQNQILQLRMRERVRAERLRQRGSNPQPNPHHSRTFGDNLETVWNPGHSFRIWTTVDRSRAGQGEDAGARRSK